MIENNKFENIKKHLAELVWGEKDIVEKWNEFRKNIKGIGPAMMSEILCKTHPDKYMLWNRRALISLKYLGCENLPKYDYQLNGKMYKYLCHISNEIAEEISKKTKTKVNLFEVDYFIWNELQVLDTLEELKTWEGIKKEKIPDNNEEAKFIHDEIKLKLQDIGLWLGFNAKTEQKVAEGSKVDTIWEATIGNMGRVIYVFEVQTKGSIDSLIINLINALDNPAVQGVVAVSDKEQIEIIKKHAPTMSGFNQKLKYWDYMEVLQVHSNLENVNQIINNLGLVPQGF